MTDWVDGTFPPYSNKVQFLAREFVWVVGYYPKTSDTIELGGVFSTREKARRAAWKAHARHRDVFFAPATLDEELPTDTTEWPNVEWVDQYNFLIVGTDQYTFFHDEHYWGDYGGNILQTSNDEIALKIAAIDRNAPTAAWLCDSANNYNWQQLQIMLGARNIPIHPLSCSHD